MKKIVFSLFVLLTSLSVIGQNWTYKQGSNAFDGNFKSCSIIGKGNEFPYTTPLFVINVFNDKIDEPNVYLSDVPSAVCDSKSAMIKFDNDTIILEPIVTTNNSKDVWFLDFGILYAKSWPKEQDEYYKRRSLYTIQGFVKQLKEHSVM